MTDSVLVIFQKHVLCKTRIGTYGKQYKTVMFLLQWNSPCGVGWGGVGWGLFSKGPTLMDFVTKELCN